MQKLSTRKLRFGCGSSLQSAFGLEHLHGSRKACLMQKKQTSDQVTDKRNHGGSEKG